MIKKKVWEIEVCPVCYSDRWIWINHNTEIGCMGKCKKDSKKPKIIKVVELG